MQASTEVLSKNVVLSAVNTILIVDRMLRLLANGVDGADYDIVNYLKIIDMMLERGATSPLRGVTVSEVSKYFGVARSTAEKKMKTLYDLGIITRRIALSKTGGYIHVYYIDKELLKRKLTEVKIQLLDVINTIDKLLHKLDNGDINDHEQ